MTKAETIKNTLKETKERRKEQICRSFLVKIDMSHLSQQKQDSLDRLFLEAKWFYNHVIANDPFSIDYKIKSVPVKVKDEFEERPLSIISSQMKQEILYDIRDSIINLAKKRKTGEKVGKLKFKSYVQSIPLKQFDNTYKIMDGKYIKIQNIKGKIRVNGLKQIPEYAEIANARLIRKHGDYYLRIVTYTFKADLAEEDEEKERAVPTDNSAIGIDFGIGRQLTFSNGIFVEYNIQPTKKLKKLYQQFSRTQKGSKNRRKLIMKIQKEYEKISNQKQDIKNKLVSYLKYNYQNVCYQDDPVKAWQRIYGKKIMNTAIGGLISALDERTHTPIAVNRFFPSTKRCSVCHNIKAMQLSDRIYTCDCGNVMDRDYNSALNILHEGLSPLPMDDRDFKPAETMAATLKMLGYFRTIPHIKASLVRETGSLTALA